MFRRVNVVLLAAATGTSGKVVNHYARLGISLDIAAAATPADLKAAYRRRALECHPDVAPTPEDKTSFEAQFRNLAESYDLLCDPESRAQLNKELLVGKKKKGIKGGSSQGSSSGEPSSSFMSSWSSPTPSSRSRTATSSKQGEEVVAPNEAYNLIREKLIRRRQEEIEIEKELFKRYTDAHHKKHKGFLRRDADRVFKSAFDGKTWDQVLFELEKVRRDGAFRASPAAPTSTTTTTSETKPADPSFSKAATRAVANRLRSRIERGGGATHGVHRILMSQGPIARSAMSAATSTPGGKHMPFRPFPMPLSQNAPLGLTADEVVPNLSEGIVDGADVVGTVKTPKMESRVVAVASQYSRSKRRELDRHNPYNMGKLYSYQRPY